MVLAVLDQSSFNDFKLRLRFEWWEILGPLYFGFGNLIRNLLYWYRCYCSWRQIIRFVFFLAFPSFFVTVVTIICPFDELRFNSRPSRTILGWLCFLNNLNLIMTLELKQNSTRLRVDNCCKYHYACHNWSKAFLFC